jgi:hypothetical protein
VAYSLIRPKSQISNIRHDGTLSIGNFMLMMKIPKNLEFHPVHPKNVLLASVVHGISCLFSFVLGLTALSFFGKQLNSKDGLMDIFSLSVSLVSIVYLVDEILKEQQLLSATNEFSHNVSVVNLRYKLLHPCCFHFSSFRYIWRNIYPTLYSSNGYK